LVVPYILSQFDFELTEEFKNIEKPTNDLDVANSMILKLKKINHIMEPVIV
jgi:hypothetical protein